MTEHQPQYKPFSDSNPRRRTMIAFKSEEDSQALQALQKLKRHNSEKAQLEEELEDLHMSAAEEISEAEEEDRSLPPRSALYPSSSGRLSRWFYNSLFILFVGLLIALLFWGRHLMVMEGS